MNITNRNLADDLVLMSVSTGAEGASTFNRKMHIMKIFYMQPLSILNLDSHFIIYTVLCVRNK